MKKRLLAVLLTGVMAMSMLTACGGSDETTTGAATEDVSVASTVSTDGEMCSDETFSILQDNYATMTDAYNAVKDLYENDGIAADEAIEDVMNQAADIINQMGEISQDSITEEDAVTLNSAMVDILDALSSVVDGMTATEGGNKAATKGCSNETFATLQQNYSTLSGVYEIVANAYLSDQIAQNDDIETTLAKTKDIMNQMGEISQDSITEEDAVVLNDSMASLLDVLDAVVDAM